MTTFDDISREMKAAARSGAAVTEIGKSVFGRSIFCAAVGSGKPVIIVTAAIHARENVTARIALLSLRRALSVFPDRKGTICFIPMVNPDGAELVSRGAAAFGRAGRELTAINGGSDDFSQWKANARGVDLNVNFDARWGEGKENRHAPSPESYVGSRPLSEPESAALARFTLRLRPDFTISLHAKGGTVLWYFGQSGEAADRDERLAAALAAGPGYRTAGRTTGGSAGGYKDWCVSRLGIPAITVEAGAEELVHPFGFSDLSSRERRELVRLPERAADLLRGE